MRIVIFITLLFVVKASTSKAALHELSDKVATHIKVLTDKAASSIHKLAGDIDLKKLDLLHVFAKKLVKKHHPPETLVIDPHQVDRLKYYFEHTHGVKEHVPAHHYGPSPHKR